MANVELPDLDGKTVYVVDSNSLIFQVFHALPEMTGPKGQPVSAVYGFTRDVIFLIQEKQPDYLFFAFDLPGRTFRHELFADYKVHRKEMPADLVPQFPAIRRMLESLGLAIAELEGFEADDILATLARVCDEERANCFLVTADKDCRQLISDRVRLFNVRKNQVLGEPELLEEWGIRPKQVVDYQALVGDPVDNVPGIPLIGPKLARELLNTYGDLEGVLEHAHEVSGKKRRENLLAGRESALLSRRLVQLDVNCPIRADWERARIKPIDPTSALELCGEFGFRGLSDRVASLGKPKESITAAQQSVRYTCVFTEDALRELVNEMSRQELLSVDTETTNLNPRLAEIVGYSFSWRPGEGFYVPVLAPAGEPRIPPEKAAELLRPVLENAAIKKVGQNLKYDMVALRNIGIRLQGVEFDTMIASYLLEAGERSHSLDELARRHLDHTTTKISELIGKGRDQKRMDEVPLAQISHYAAEDADIPLRLREVLAPKLRDAELENLFSELEMPLTQVLAEMEFNGITVDIGHLNRLSSIYSERIHALEAEIHDLAGKPFNIASPKQLAEILFVEQRLPILRKTKTGPSTDASVLEELAKVHPLPAKIIEYRQYAKLKNTYVDALPELVNPHTGRIHSCFNQVVAATGRLSSNEPNLQNIPIRTEQGREIRGAFLPKEQGWKLLAADYSQIELRILAHFSQDDVLCGAFSENQDIHRLVAAQVRGIGQEDVTSDMRRSAKAINFGIIYGQSAFGLAKQLGIDQHSAQEFIDSYFARYPKVAGFLTKTLVNCRQNGYVKTILGRRRAIAGVREIPVDFQQSLFADGSAGLLESTQLHSRRSLNLSERTAVNTVIQGSAADLIKSAMLAIHNRLQQSNLSAKMLLQIHDELIFEVPEEEATDLADIVTSEMSNVIRLDVPLKVDVKSGDNWAACEPW